MTRWDVAIIGGGLLGLSVARNMAMAHRGLKLVVLEKEDTIASHQSGRNSGVVHRGIYYAPGSLKARLCTVGADRLTQYCDTAGIPWRRTGKVIVAVDDGEIPALQELHRRGVANGVPELELIGPDRLRELEPAVVGVGALHSPHTGIVDFTRVAHAYAADAASLGAEIRTRSPVVAISERASGVELQTPTGEVAARYFISCAGLHADRVAAMTDPSAMRRIRIVPFRGDYYVLRSDRAHLCRSLIYPVPDPRFPFLGVHFTRRMDGSVWAGPNAVLALARDRYRRRDVRWRDVVDALGFRGFWRMAVRHWEIGAAEVWRDVMKSAFAGALRRYVPELRDEDLVPGPAGNRAQAVGVDGRLLDDFRIRPAGRGIHVLNAPSPAATSSLAIADVIATMADERFRLKG